MRKLFLAALLSIAAFSSAFAADVYVRGYTRSDGTYVAPHYRSSPNSTRNDNWSTRGNINPHTGRLGTKNPDYNYGSSSPYKGSTTRQPSSTLRAPRQVKPFLLSKQQHEEAYCRAPLCFILVVGVSCDASQKNFANESRSGSACQKQGPRLMDTRYVKQRSSEMSYGAETYLVKNLIAKLIIKPATIEVTKS